MTELVKCPRHHGSLNLKVKVCTRCHGDEAKCPFQLNGKCYGETCLLCGNEEQVTAELSAAYRLLISTGLADSDIPANHYFKPRSAHHDVIAYLFYYTDLLNAKARELYEVFMLELPSQSRLRIRD